MKETMFTGAPRISAGLPATRYIVYGPMANGATPVMYEGTPDWPDKDRLWRIIEKYGVTIFHTAPTAIRTFMRWGTELPAKNTTQQSCGFWARVGEPINPEAWVWYHTYIGGGRCPVDGHLVADRNRPSTDHAAARHHATETGSATQPFPGIEADVVDENGKSVPQGRRRLSCSYETWPAMMRTIYGDPGPVCAERTGAGSRESISPATGAKRDKDGYFWLLGRVDDVMNVAGHRISTMEVESALVDHQKVAEAAVIGKEHEIKGQGDLRVRLTEGRRRWVHRARWTSSKQHVAKKIGPIARPDDILFAAELPKTRSGKIMRRLLRDIADGRALGDTTTLADPNVVAKLKEQYGEE